MENDLKLDSLDFEHEWYNRLLRLDPLDYVRDFNGVLARISHKELLMVLGMPAELPLKTTHAIRDAMRNHGWRKIVVRYAPMKANATGWAMDLPGYVSMKLRDFRRRFFDRVAGTPNGCDKWDGGLSVDYNGVSLAIPRAAWLAHHYTMAPDTAMVKHTCQTTGDRCVSLNHLQLKARPNA